MLQILQPRVKKLNQIQDAHYIKAHSSEERIRFYSNTTARKGLRLYQIKEANNVEAPTCYNDIFFFFRASSAQKVNLNSIKSIICIRIKHKARKRVYFPRKRPANKMIPLDAFTVRKGLTNKGSTYQPS